MSMTRAAEGLWVNTDLAAKMFRTMDPPVVKKVNLFRLWHRGGLEKECKSL